MAANKRNLPKRAPDEPTFGDPNAVIRKAPRFADSEVDVGIAVGNDGAITDEEIDTPKDIQGG